jgi:DNA-binding XRE family transcriptional regulator
MKLTTKKFDQIVREKNLGVFWEDDLRERLKDPEFKKAWEEPTGDVYLDTAWEIIQARKKKKMSQAALAKKVGTSQQAVARLENPSYRGRSLATLEKVAKALGKKLEVRFT